MNLVLKSSIKTLQKSSRLLDILTNKQLSNHSVSPYYSSIGSHLRHIFDFYACILNEDNLRIDLTTRNRDSNIESCCTSASAYLKHLLNRLQNMSDDLEREVYVIDDLGMGKIEMKYTLGALLAQANSHTIHHYAIINYILDRLNIAMNDDTFGYNPTTPRPEVNLN